MSAESKIVREKRGYVVYSEDGKKKLGGPYKTREEADKRLQQVEHFKNAGATVEVSDTTHSSSTMKLAYANMGPQAMKMADWGQIYDLVAPRPFELCGSVGVVNICGPLVEHSGTCWMSYEGIASDARAAFECAETQSVLLKINSRGGDAAGCMELSRLLRQLSEESGKPLATYIDGMCASAAYAIASSAQEITCPPTATVGSIGVFEPIIDETARDAAMGVKITFVASGKLKLTGNPHVPTSKEAVASVGRGVDELSGLFFDLVSDHRPLSRAEVVGLEGEAFIGQQALDNGLVDSIQVYADLLARLATEGTAMPAQAKNDSKAWDAMKEALMSYAEGEDEDKARKAKKMLKAFASDEKPEDAPEKDEAAKADVEDGDKDKEPVKAAKSEDAPEDKDKKPEGSKAEEPEDKKAQATLATLAKRVHDMESEKLAEKQTKAKAALLDTRPDFSAEVRATLESLDIATVTQAVKNWKRAPGFSASASMTIPTVLGKGQGEFVAPIDGAQQDAINRAFKRGTPVVAGDTITGTGNREAAKAYLEQLDKARTAQNGVK
jgi:ClpP class serine protease